MKERGSEIWTAGCIDPVAVYEVTITISAICVVQHGHREIPLSGFEVSEEETVLVDLAGYLVEVFRVNVFAVQSDTKDYQSPALVVSTVNKVIS